MIAAIVALPDIKERLGALGYEPIAARRSSAPSSSRRKWRNGRRSFALRHQGGLAGGMEGLGSMKALRAFGPPSPPRLLSRGMQTRRIGRTGRSPMVAPFATGGSTDAIARIVAEGLSASSISRLSWRMLALLVYAGELIAVLEVES